MARQKCHRPDCSGFDGKKYRFHGSQWVRKSVVDNPNDNESDDAPVLTSGVVIEEGVCPHEKQAFGDLLEPLETDHDSAEQELSENFDLSDYTTDKLNSMAKALGLSGYSSLNKAEKINYIKTNAGTGFDPEAALEDVEKSSTSSSSSDSGS